MALILLRKPREQNVGPALHVGNAPPPILGTCEYSAPTIVAFLRHVGCPFAEQTVKKLRQLADENPHLQFYIVSHGDQQATDHWLETIGGGGRLAVIVDPNRELYGQWGVGYSDLRHFLGLRSLLGVLSLLLKGIRNRSACGTRWQRAAMFFIEQGEIKWKDLPAFANELTLPPAQLLG